MNRYFGDLLNRAVCIGVSDCTSVSIIDLPERVEARTGWFGLLLLYRKLHISYRAKKRSAMDAHSRDWKMSQATALGARVSQAKLFVPGIYLVP